MILTLLSIIAQAGPENVIGGGAGWVGAGLFGLVLGWLLLVHLPAKDKQITDLFKVFQTEREFDRANREEGAKFFREALAEINRHYIQVGKEQLDAFEKRIFRVEEAMKTVCKMNEPHT